MTYGIIMKITKYVHAYVYPSYHVWHLFTDIQDQWVTDTSVLPSVTTCECESHTSVFRQDGPQLTIERFSFFKVKSLRSFLFSSACSVWCWITALTGCHGNGNFQTGSDLWEGPNEKEKWAVDLIHKQRVWPECFCFMWSATK